MRPLSTADLLTVWEQGLGQTLIQRALTLLAAACPEIPPAQLAQLSIGQRDALLLSLRELTFGPRLVSLATCPFCGERLEVNCTVANLRVSTAPEPVAEMTLSLSGYELCFRVPDSLDMTALDPREDLAAAEMTLLRRCLLKATYQGEARTAERLPEAILERIVQQMAEADPQAEVCLTLSCTSCSHAWQAVFDIVTFFWREIQAWTQRILGEVHILASAYGWREADILALSPTRRQMYLDIVQG